ncbi:MAG: amidase [Planctomycetaceae bacterium]|nr:amidase [Planctomycetaceae bacterium]
MDASHYLDSSLIETAGAIAAGAVTGEAVVRAAIERIEGSPEARACFVRFRPDAALREAARGDAGTAGRLRGIPMAHKDLFAIRGERSTFCAQPSFHLCGTATAPAIDALDRAGAVNLGGLHMAEFAMGAAGWNEVHGFLANPHHRDHLSGGSSSGSAAAVAMRLVHAALGSDTGGSIRVPCSFCGVIGFKPTNGVVPVEGVYPVSPTLDTVGVVTRTVEDCALMMDVLTGGGTRYGDALEGRGGRVRLGFLAPESYPTPPEPEALAAVEAARLAAERAGYAVTEIRSDLPAHGAIPAGIVFVSEAGAVHLDHMCGNADSVGEQVRNRMLLGMTYPASVYIRAINQREAVRRRWRDEILSRVDALVCPSTPCHAPRRDDYAGLDADGAIAMNGRLGSYTAWVNYVGLPAVSVPLYWSGLPIGVQVVGDRYGDAEVLRIARDLMAAI